jgi:KipI family sensor histidine kinase inhibitor
MVTLASFGAHAWLLALDRPPTRATRDALRAVSAVDDVVLCEGSALLVLRDDAVVDHALRTALASALDAADLRAPVSHELAVRYDGEDLDAVAAAVGLRPDEVVRVHSAGEYTVRSTGFLPGFAYLGVLDERLRVARRATPRARVTAGSVAIADARTGVYPFASPGGWSLLGSIADDWRAFDPDRGATLELGDRVRFVAVDRFVTRERASSPPAAISRGRGLRIEWSEAPALVQDGGRARWMHAGIARGGALWKGRLALANRALGQPWNLAAIECYGAMRLRAEGGTVAVSIDGEARTIADGALVELGRPGRARVQYLAIEGGVRATPQLGGRGQHLRAGLGGIDRARDRPLRRGDVVLVGDGDFSETQRAPEERADDAALDEAFVIAIDAIEGSRGRFADGALEGFTSRTAVILPQSDRTGMRLDALAPRADADLGESAPMCEGAIEVAADGAPIVLGVDHPTTGGYPVLAVVAREHLGPLFARRPGARVRFARRA